MTGRCLFLMDLPENMIVDYSLVSEVEEVAEAVHSGSKQQRVVSLCQEEVGVWGEVAARVEDEEGRFVAVER